MRYDAHYALQPGPAMVGEGIAGLAEGVVGLTVGAFVGGVFTARRMAESLMWGSPPYPDMGYGSACGCCVVHHHYRYTCVPPCQGCGCC